jgi:glutaredoxin-like YruB-family protein
MRKIIATTLILVGALAAAAQGADTPAAPQSRIDIMAPQHRNYPKIVLYSVAWCPHCKAAKEYFTQNNIPFINKDVEIDPKAMEELTGKYKSQGVPVVIIGDKKVLKGFSPEAFEKAVKDFQKK